MTEKIRQPIKSKRTECDRKSIVHERTGKASPIFHPLAKVHGYGFLVLLEDFLAWVLFIGYSRIRWMMRTEGFHALESFSF